jgi:hypothetical protein
MASDGSSNTGAIAIFAILLMVLIGSLVAYRVGVFGDSTHRIDLKVRPK